MKCIILCMSCNLDYYQRYESMVRDTWGRPVLEGWHDNIDLWFCTSGDFNGIDTDKHIIYVNTKDNLFNTFNKCIKTFEIIDKYFDYDFILKTNCTTVVNIQLLTQLIDTLDPTKTYINSFVDCNDNMDTFSGFFIMFPRFMIKWFIQSQYENVLTINDEVYINYSPDRIFQGCDDQIMTYLFKMYYNNRNIDFMDNICFIASGHYKNLEIKNWMVRNYNETYAYNVDEGYDELNLEYFSKFLTIRCKVHEAEEHLSDFNLTIDDVRYRTLQNIYELGNLFMMKIDDDLIQYNIQNIHKELKYSYRLVNTYHIFSKAKKEIMNEIFNRK